MSVTFGALVMTGCVGGGEGLEPEDNPDGGGEEGCLDSLDCADDEFCHPDLGECVANCVLQEGICDGETPVCNEDNGGTRPLDDPDYNNLCICSDTSCGEGRVCSATTGLCEDAPEEGCADDVDCDEGFVCDVASGECVADECSDDTDCEEGFVCDIASGECIDDSCTEAADCDANQDCDVLTGECFDLCTSVGAQDTCLDGEICVYDGTCSEPCDTDTCLLADELCYSNTEDADYNNCVAPDLETGRCDSAAEFDLPRTEADANGDNSGPIIWDVEYYAEPAFDGDCPGNGSVAYVVDFFYQDADGDAYAAHSVDAYNNFLWVETGSTPSVSTWQLQFGDTVSGSAGDVGMVICFISEPAELAVQIKDEAGNLSNAACASLAAAP
jgi:hypothetical protein